jgi:hypothetical protein
MDLSIVTLEILRSQILDIHHNIEQALINQTVRKSTAKYKLNETRKTLVRINITCVDSGEQTLVVEELARLYSLAESLRTSLDNLTRPPTAALAEDL